MLARRTNMQFWTDNSYNIAAVFHHLTEDSWNILHTVVDLDISVI